jgi:L-ascorbate metabolism protein UlaG (beta-lactamase superfamily)
LKIITDPYATSPELTYSPIDETADIVTVSHEHIDHNNVRAIKGQPEVVKGVGVKTVKGIEFKGIASWHDDVQGARQGPNTVICFTVDRVKFCHLGDLGHRLSPEQVTKIGEVDVLFIPYWVSYETCNDLKAKIIIPMHYKTPKVGVGFATGGVDEFLEGKDNVKRLSTTILELKPMEVPTTPQIIVLEMAKY